MTPAPADGAGSGRRGGVLCVGRAYCDLIFTDVARMPSMGTEVFAGGLGVHAGGGAPIAAAHAAAAGRPSFLAATLPQAPFGEICAEQLRAAGVDLSLCRAAEAGADPQVTMAIAGPVDRAFVTRRAGPAAPDLTPGQLAGLGLAHLHIGELTTLVEMPGLIDLARAAGLTLSLDCAWDDANDAVQAAPLIAQVDVFLPNASEAAWLADSGVQAPFAPLTVIKRGPDGAVAMRGDERVECRAGPGPPGGHDRRGRCLRRGVPGPLAGRRPAGRLPCGGQCGGGTGHRHSRRFRRAGGPGFRPVSRGPDRIMQ